MEGSARGAPFCKKIFFVSVELVDRVERRERIERDREKRGEPRLCCSPSSNTL
jgi:hypothetical protein